MAEDPSSGSAFFIVEAPGVRQSESTWSLDAESDLSLSLEFASARSHRPNMPSKFSLIIDGIQRPFVTAAGLEETAYDVDVAEGSRDSLSILVRSSDLTVGAHTVAMVLLSMETGRLLDRRLITVFHGGTLFEEREVVREVALQDRVYIGQFAFGAGRHLYQAIPFVWPQKGLVDFELLLQTPDGIGCSNQANPVTGIVLMDGLQVPMGVGPYATVLVDANHGARIKTTITVPEDDRHHVLSVLQITGDGRYTEAPLGTPAPWSHTFVNQLGYVNW